MWLPVQFTFSRNDSVKAVQAGKYSNIRGIFTPSADTPKTGGWMTAQQAVKTASADNPYSLFDMVSD
jgi:hypothetical protein